MLFWAWTVCRPLSFDSYYFTCISSVFQILLLSYTFSGQITPTCYDIWFWIGGRNKFVHLFTNHCFVKTSNLDIKTSFLNIHSKQSEQICVNTWDRLLEVTRLKCMYIHNGTHNLTARNVQHQLSFIQAHFTSIPFYASVFVLEIYITKRYKKVQQISRDSS